MERQAIVTLTVPATSKTLLLPTEDTDGTFEPVTATAILTGALFDGTLFEGVDSICIVS